MSENTTSVGEHHLERELESNIGSGRTTRQMQDAPIESIFVWCNSMVSYPKSLAKHLGRNDLVIQPLHWLRIENIAGRDGLKIVVDHAARLDDRNYDALACAKARGAV